MCLVSDLKSLQSPHMKNNSKASSAQPVAPAFPSGRNPNLCTRETLHSSQLTPEHRQPPSHLLGKEKEVHHDKEVAATRAGVTRIQTRFREASEKLPPPRREKTRGESWQTPGTPHNLPPPAQVRSLPTGAVNRRTEPAHAAPATRMWAGRSSRAGEAAAAAPHSPVPSPSERRLLMTGSSRAPRALPRGDPQ